ncbi:MAG: lantibiotic immunity ABC transporter MutG family permease subunit [Thermoactinomyces sp.]
MNSPIFLRILASDWLKTKRSPGRRMIFIIPVLTAVLFIWYFSKLPLSHDLQFKIYQAFFEFWTALVIPVGAGVLAGVLVQQEEFAGSFIGLLGSPYPRTSHYLGKLLILILQTSVSSLLAVLILLGGLKLFFGIDVSWKLFLLAVIMAEAGTLPLLALHLWIGMALGFGVTVGIGGGGVLLAALVGATSLGNTIWQYVPWAWPVRLSLSPGLFFPGIDFPASMTPLTLFWHQTLKAVVPSTMLFVFLVAGGCIWFNKWEGRKIQD